MANTKKRPKLRRDTHRVFVQFYDQIAFINRFKNEAEAHRLVATLRKRYPSHEVNFWTATHDAECCATWSVIRDAIGVSVPAWEAALAREQNVPPQPKQQAQPSARYIAHVDRTKLRVERRKKHKAEQRARRKEIKRAQEISQANYVGNLSVAIKKNAPLTTASILRKRTPT